MIEGLTQGLIEGIKILLEKGFKNTVVFIAVTICVTISISPTFLFVLIFNNKLFNSVSTGMMIGFIIIISCILLYLMYMTTAMGNIRTQDCSKSYLDIVSNLSYSILKLSILSFIILTSYYIMYLFTSINYNIMFLIIGIYILIVFSISFIKFIIEKIRRKATIRENNKKYKLLVNDFNILKEALENSKRENKELRKKLNME